MIKHGVGYASAWQGLNFHFGHPDISTVSLELTDQLRYRIGVAAADLGEGIPETLAVILSQELGGVPASQIEFIDPDTGVTPDGGATGASRQTALTGNATLKAAKKLALVLKKTASEILDSPPDEVTIKEGIFYGRGGVTASLAEIEKECRRIGLSLSVLGFFQAPLTEPLDDKGQGFGVNQFSYATYIAEVDVDTDTGEVNVTRVSAFVDAGKIVRRIGAEMQVEGGIAMGLGHTLTEEFKQRQGWPETDGFTTYLIPTIQDVPLEITSDFVGEWAPMGELGAKGLAELVLVPVAPAITNAIYNAVRVRITTLPATPERVFMALRSIEDKEQQ
ncbi:MAG TPA: molybdopterin cofactor-binding domain-containing protein [Anaerolineales bacterium]|nr:molybdopterin cofactor-binding domain-containing protein [Anaerolineales bacterium]